MSLKSEKIWVVIECSGDGAINAVSYDNPTDADSYADEMAIKRGPQYNIRVVETELNRREEIPFDDAPWGTLRMDIKSEFVEGLMEDMVPLGQIAPGAAERFVTEKIEMVRRRAATLIDEIVRHETKEELMHSHEEWITSKGMED